MKDLTIVRGLDWIRNEHDFHDEQPVKLIYSKANLIAYEPSPNVYYPAS